MYAQRDPPDFICGYCGWDVSESATRKLSPETAIHSGRFSLSLRLVSLPPHSILQ
jgi:hypothetical protein